MTDFSNQITDFQRQWMNQQQRWMSDWLGTLENMGGGSPPGTWQQAVDVIEHQVKAMLDTQKQSLMTLAENRQGDMPESMKDWVKQMEDGISQWNQMQEQMWDNWFEMLRSSAPTTDKPGDAFMKNWQEFTDQAMEMQRQWLSGWGEEPARGRKASKKKTARKVPVQEESKPEE